MQPQPHIVFRGWLMMGFCDVERANDDHNFESDHRALCAVDVVKPVKKISCGIYDCDPIRDCAASERRNWFVHSWYYFLFIQALDPLRGDGYTRSANFAAQSISSTRIYYIGTYTSTYPHSESRAGVYGVPSPILCYEHITQYSSIASKLEPH